MKKLSLLLAVLVSIPVFGHAEFSSTKSRVYVSPDSFRASDDLSSITNGAQTTTPYFAYPAAIKMRAVVFPSPEVTPPAVTTEFTIPNDMVGGPAGNGRLYALVHLSSVTGTAQLKATFIQSGEFNGITVTTSWAGITCTSGATAFPIPSSAATSVVRYELLSATSTATAGNTLPFQPNRLVHVSLSAVGTTTADMEIYGLVFEYNHDPKRKR